MGPRHIQSFCACKTACLAPELLVSIIPSPHQWFLHAKERLLDQNYKSLWVPDLTCRFVHKKWEWFAPEWQVYMGSSPHLWFFSCKTATLRPDLLVSVVPRSHLWICAIETASLPLELLVSVVPDLTCAFLRTKQLAIQVPMGPRPHLWICECKTASLAPE